MHQASSMQPEIYCLFYKIIWYILGIVDRQVNICKFLVVMYVNILFEIYVFDEYDDHLITGKHYNSTYNKNPCFSSWVV